MFTQCVMYSYTVRIHKNYLTCKLIIHKNCYESGKSEMLVTFVSVQQKYPNIFGVTDVCSQISDPVSVLGWFSVTEEPLANSNSGSEMNIKAENQWNGIENSVACKEQPHLTLIAQLAAALAGTCSVRISEIIDMEK